MAFEEDLLVNPYDMRTWQRYLESKRLFLLSQGEHVTSSCGSDKMTFLYERVCKLLPGSFKLWKEYLDLLQESLKNPEIVIGAFERALTTLHRMPRIWLDYLDFLVQSKKFKKIRRVFDRALRALPITQHSRLWDFIFTKFIRRFGTRLPNWSKSFWERYLQIAPEKRTEYIKFLKKIEDWDTAARELVVLANSLMKSTNDLIQDRKKAQVRRPKDHESDFDDSESDSDDEVDLNLQKCWDSLCRVFMEHSHEIVSVSVDSILRTAISVFKREQGRYWTALATFHMRRGYFDSARLIFEEAMGKVFLVRDFAQIFDSYAKMEETLLEILIEDAAESTTKNKKGRKSVAESNSSVSADVLIQMGNLRSLLERHGFLLNDVLLRQNPHSVNDWLERIKLVRQASNDQVEAVMEAFEDALRTVNPRKVAVHQIWTELASFLESKESFGTARQIYSRACEWGQVDYGTVEDVASVFISAAEFEFRRDAVEDGLEIISSALSPGRKKTGNEAWDSLGKSLRLWNFLIDSEEARGATGACEAAYERLLQLRLAQPQHIINYALFREEVLKDLDGSFKIYERGIELINYPVAFEIWNIYLPKFVKRYGNTRLERTRDLFESALQGCPEKFAVHLFLMYAKVEEEYGLIRNSLVIYRRASGIVAASDRPIIYNLLINKTIESQGAFSARPIYEDAIKSLPFPASLPFALAHSALEEQLNELPRARALFIHIAQFCDPRAYEQSFWQIWQEFETRNGDESSFREMLRIKRSVSNLFLQKLPFVKAAAPEISDLSNEKPDDSIKEQNDEEMELDL